jgi:hypothetical protein
MSAHVPALPLEDDPLIAEAKQRAPQRRCLFLAFAAAAFPTELLVTPPGGHTAVAVAARIPFCGPRYFWSLPIGRAP